MRKIILFSIITLLTSTFGIKTSQNFTIHDYPYQKQAIKWTKNYIIDNNNNFLAYPEEIQLLANLIYLSFKRSECTLQAQEKSLKVLETFWKGWQNIAQTRMDPSISQPFAIPKHEKQCENIAQFWQLHDEHRKTGITYNHSVQNIVNGKSLITIYAQDSVNAMRNQARTVVAKSLINVKNYFGEIFHGKKKFQKILSYINFIWQYLPKLALNSFVEANKTNNLVSQESWEVLIKIQNASKKTWQIIEQDRASFYLAFYKAIWHSMKKLNLEQDYFKILFDKKGRIKKENQFDYLPDPAQI